jgi:hypothetical protein
MTMAEDIVARCRAVTTVSMVTRASLSAPYDR